MTKSNNQFSNRLKSCVKKLALMLCTTAISSSSFAVVAKVVEQPELVSIKNNMQTTPKLIWPNLLDNDTEVIFKENLKSIDNTINESMNSALNYFENINNGSTQNFKNYSKLNEAMDLFDVFEDLAKIADVSYFLDNWLTDTSNTSSKIKYAWYSSKNCVISYCYDFIANHYQEYKEMNEILGMVRLLKNVEKSSIQDFLGRARTQTEYKLFLHALNHVENYINKFFSNKKTEKEKDQLFPNISIVFNILTEIEQTEWSFDQNDIKRFNKLYHRHLEICYRWVVYTQFYSTVPEVDKEKYFQFNDLESRLEMMYKIKEKQAVNWTIKWWDGKDQTFDDINKHYNVEFNNYVEKLKNNYQTLTTKQTLHAVELLDRVINQQYFEPELKNECFTVMKNIFDYQITIVDILDLVNHRQMLNTIIGALNKEGRIDNHELQEASRSLYRRGDHGFSYDLTIFGL